MGSPADESQRAFVEGPQHWVTIASAFAAGRFEVTYAEWDACVSASGCQYRPRDPGWGRGRHPVVNVSWDDITQEYLPWLSRTAGHTYRLLTEAEWEYAARAGTGTPFAFGGTITTVQANFDGTSTYGDAAKGIYRQRTLAVGAFPPNGFGLYDMAGNAAEWVEDCYADGYRDAPSDGRAIRGAPDCAHVLRGGSWIDAPRALRSAYRSHVFSNSRFIYRGFRVARAL